MKNLTRVFVLPAIALLTSLYLVGCAGTGGVKSDTSSAQARSKASALNQDEASQRAKQVMNVSYNLWFAVDETHLDFNGRTVIKFELKKGVKNTDQDLLVDFEAGTIHSLKLNEAQISDISSRYDGHKIRFNTKELQSGINRIEVAYTHAYSKDGTGLHRSKDPADGEVYLYTDFEPYEAHHAFPCFDQPDIKAKYEVTVEAPEDWEVISNTIERDVNKVDGRKSWAFPPTPVFSTYLFAIAAGPYKSWKSDANGIPLRLFARRSVAQHVDYQEWLEVTRKGFEFFTVQFGYHYPFLKYDQIIVPDFNSGAMENVGAVTFNEQRYVFRSKVTEDRKMSRANTILHELAHMWFGNLVTMKWWNGLWLNESFASFAASLALDNATRFRRAWQSFYDMKLWAYWEDQLVTTHPIEVPVSNTDQAASQFDGITYGKGASVLKQLRFYLGEDDFREGLQRYFQKHAFKNTQIGDFFGMMAEASGKGAELNQWQQAWLQTPGVNGLKAEWACTEDEKTKKSKISSFKLIQSGSDSYPNPRSHKTQIALYSLKGGKLQVKDTAVVAYSAAETGVSELIGKSCPEMVFPNHEDYDYVKVELDPISLGTAQKYLSKVDSPLARQMLWGTLWEMVVDGKIRAQDYAEMIFQHGGHEKDTLVIARMLRNLVSSSATANSVMRFLPVKLRTEYMPKIEKFLHQHLTKAPAGSDIQLLWYHAFLESASQPTSVEYVQSLLEGKAKLSGLKIDQERRWELIKVLARNGFTNTAEIIAAEIKKDPTDMGQRAAIAAEALLPQPESKKKWLGRILRTPEPGTEPLPVAKLREAMSQYNVLSQEDFIRTAVDPYFESIPKLVATAKAEDQTYLWTFAREMFPSLCDSSIAQRTTELLNQYPDMPPTVLKALKVHRQQEERCIRARTKAEATSG